MWVGDRPGEVVLYLPEGEVHLAASWSIGWLFQDRKIDSKLGEMEFAARTGDVQHVEFAIDPLPDVGRQR